MLLTLAACACALWHPNSVSSSRLVVDGRELAFELRCQVRTLVEACPAVDRDGDGALTQAELDAGRARLAKYLGEHHVITVDRDAQTPVVLELDSLRLAHGSASGASTSEDLVD